MKTVIKAGLVVLSSLALIAADDPPASTPVADYPEPPAVIAKMIVDGRLELGSFEYLRGYFPEASEAEKADHTAILAWLDQCEAEGRVRFDAELAELGVSIAEETLMGAGAANVCQQFVRGERFEGFESYEELAQASRGARLVFNTLVQSIERADQRAQPLASDDLGAELHHRTLGEQMLRLAFRWGWSETSKPRNPSMTRQERTVFLALLNSEVLWVDHQNTQWLKQIVAEHGWPTRSKVGERGAVAAWLLTQHADLDPAFQLRALRLMEPLLAQGEVSKRRYAYLYDRIHLKLTGKQRYATQLACEDGELVALPLEEPERVDELRAEMDLDPFAEYLNSVSLPCPVD